MLCHEASYRLSMNKNTSRLTGLGSLGSTDSRRLDPLSEAVRQGHVECVKFLAGRMDPCAEDERGRSPIVEAASTGLAADCLRAMAPRVGSDKKSRKIAYDALVAAAHHGNAEGVEALLGFCDDSARQMPDDWTAMMAAIGNGHLDCVKLLAEKSDFGAYANDDRGDLMTAWDLAANFRDNGIHAWLRNYFFARDEKIAFEKMTPKGVASPSKARL